MVEHSYITNTIVGQNYTPHKHLHRVGQNFKTCIEGTKVHNQKHLYRVGQKLAQHKHLYTGSHNQCITEDNHKE